MYDMLRKYMNGGKVTKYADGGVGIKHTGREEGPNFWRGSHEKSELGKISNRSKLLQLLGFAQHKLSFHAGGIVHDHPHTDPTKKVANNTRWENTVSATYRDNEGLKEAVSPGKIDAYNFSLPSSGLLEDLDEETKSTIRNSDFGKKYLSGEGSIDDQYNAYATKAARHMSENPTQVLSAINEMIESGNKNFQGLKGKTDEEKLKLATSYMTDKKIGDFHGALELTKTEVPRVQFYESTSSNIRGPQNEKTLISIGDESLREGEVINFRRAAEEAGVNVDSDTPEARKFLKWYMGLYGSMDISEGRESGKDNQAYVTSAAQGRLSHRELTDLQKQRQNAIPRQVIPRYDGQGRRIN
jgi:hypothetical protein